MEKQIESILHLVYQDDLSHDLSFNIKDASYIFLC